MLTGCSLRLRLYTLWVWVGGTLVRWLICDSQAHCYVRGVGCVVRGEEDVGCVVRVVTCVWIWREYRL